MSTFVIPEEQGQRRAIVNGYDAPQRQFYVRVFTAVWALNENVTAPHWIVVPCSGVLVRQEWVLTSAICLSGEGMLFFKSFGSKNGKFCIRF